MGLFFAMCQEPPLSAASILAPVPRGDNPRPSGFRRNLRLLSIGAKDLQIQHFLTFVASFRNAC